MFLQYWRNLQIAAPTFLVVPGKETLQQSISGAAMEARMSRVT